MAQKNRAALRAQMEDGDSITQDTLGDLIDSCVNLVDTTAQAYASNIEAPGLKANTVSANTVFTDVLVLASAATLFAGTVCANTVVGDTVRVSGALSGNRIFGDLVQVSAVRHKNPFGMIWMDAATTQTSVSATPVRLSSDVTARPSDLRGFTWVTADGARLTYLGVSAAMCVTYHVNGAISNQTELTASQFVGLQVALNGTVDPSTRAAVAAVSARTISLSNTSIVQMQSGDVVDLMIDVTGAVSASFAVRAYKLIAYPVSWHY